MTRSWHPSEISPRAVFSLALFLVVLAALGIPSRSYAQRGAAGGRMGGGHVSAGAHLAGGHIATGPRAISGRHFAAGPHGGRIAARSRLNHYLAYRPYGTRNPLHAASFQSAFYRRTAFRSRPLPFSHRHAYFRNRFYPYGFWGWGDWGWDTYGWSDCDPNEWDCQNGESYPDGYRESHDETAYEQPDESRPAIIVYLRDGSGYGALDYWLTNGVLHIETTYGTEKSFPLDQVDVQRTFTENTARGVTFTLLPYPMSSDPGPMLAPDSYAPECGSTEPAVTQSSASLAMSSATSWFGASGNASDRGFAVTSVRSDSPAAQLGVRPGDTVVRVNCQQVKTAVDIESALNSTTGPVWVSFLIRGAWLTDKKITR